MRLKKVQELMNMNEICRISRHERDLSQAARNAQKAEAV
jgi:hypothetical protein